MANDTARRPPTTEHNHVAKVLALTAKQKPGTAIDVDVLHDDWCDLYNNRGCCNCDPDVSVRKYPS